MNDIDKTIEKLNTLSDRIDSRCGELRKTADFIRIYTDNVDEYLKRATNPALKNSQKRTPDINPENVKGMQAHAQAPLSTASGTALSPAPEPVSIAGAESESN